MPGFKVIQSNTDKTVGIVVGAKNLKDVGEFTLKNLKDWIKQVELVLGTEDDIRIQFKACENPKTPGYAIFASHDGLEPHVSVVGMYLADGTPWEKDQPGTVHPTTTPSAAKQNANAKSTAGGKHA